jgi:hypothetical protein
VVSDPDRYAAQILARFFFSSLVTFRLRLARARARAWMPIEDVAYRSNKPWLGSALAVADSREEWL